MKRLRNLMIFVLAVPATLAAAADSGIYTLVDGEARVLRGTTWYRLAAGARVLEGDIVDAGEHAQLQIELTNGGTLNLQGPALVHAVDLPSGDDKPTASAEIAAQRGWFKAAVPSGKHPLRLRLPIVAVDVADAIAVLHADPGLVELFLESGGARLSVPVARGREGPPREAKSGEFWSRTGDRAFVTASRPPSAFLSAMPRQFRDALPGLAKHYPEAPELAAGRDLTLAEAEPWLSSSSRRMFIKRFTPRLADPAFRAGVAARPAAFPEWDRILHPEKYRPREPSEVK